MTKHFSLNMFICVLSMCLSHFCFSNEHIEENTVNEKMFENPKNFYSYLQKYHELTGKNVPTPVSSMSMKVFRLVNACIKFRTEQGESNSEPGLSLWQGWNVDVYESRKNNVVRFYLKNSEDAEILCFVDNSFRVSEF